MMLYSVSKADSIASVIFWKIDLIGLVTTKKPRE